MKTIILFLSIIPVFVSCSKSGRRALESGEYFNAVLQSIEKLKRDPDNSKALEVLPNAYKYASLDLLEDIDRAKNANQQFKFERVLDDYQKLNEMHDKIEASVSCRNIVKASSHFSEFDEAREIAATERYNFGNDLLQKGTMNSARLAYDSFEILYRYAPDFKDVKIKIEEALFQGSYHVVVEPPLVNSKLYQFSNEYFQGRIDEFLQTNRRLNKFIRFYQPIEAKTLKLVPDHVVKLEFIDFVVGETIVNNEKKTVTSKDSVKTGTAKIEGKNVDVYSKVNAIITKSQKTVRSRGLLSMEIYDFKTNKSLIKEQLPGEFYWNNSWASFNGDERALTKEELNLTRNREELPPPPQQMFIEFCKPIYDQFTYRIKRFYEKY